MYDVIQDYNIEDLMETVRQRLSDGWVLAGGISMVYEIEATDQYNNPLGSYRFAQAIAKDATG